MIDLLATVLSWYFIVIFFAELLSGRYNSNDRS